LGGPYDIAVIGGGIAGLTATNHALLGGCSVAHVIGAAPIGGLVCNIGQLQGYPAGEQPLSGIGKAINLSNANLELGAVEIAAEANSVTAAGNRFLIDTSDGEIIARNVIAATGARLRTLDVPGYRELMGRGISQCAWCDGALYKARDVVVVGGGDAALEGALHLAKFASQVTVITKGETFRARQSYVSRIADLANVEFRWMSDVTAIIGDDAVESVRIDNRESGSPEEIACSAAFVFIGLEPNSALLQGLAQIDETAHVVTDGRMQTQTRGLYAVGAVRAGYGGRLVHAVGEAASAAVAAVANCCE
jgi:thioredoxin reductase (NADPH)